MIKTLFALLMLIVALSGGSYAFFGSRSRKRVLKDETSALIRRYERYLTAPPSPPAPKPSLSTYPSSSTVHVMLADAQKFGGQLVSGSPATSASTFVVTSRIAAVFVAALVLGTAAYLGLGGSGEVDADNPPPNSEAAAQLIHQDTQSLLSREVATQVPTPAPTPTAVPATEAPALAVAAAEPAPGPEPVVEAYVPPQVYAPEGGIEAIICSMAWPCGEAISVASCESGTDTSGRLDGNWATNGNHFGLFQISGIHAWKWADFWDAWMVPERNVQYAYDIWSQSGWAPWSCRPW